MVLFMGEQPEQSNLGIDQSGDRPKPKSDWMQQIDAERAFRLVDSILPFEACLFHQILPLSLDGSRLTLGMVNLDDAAALDYVRRILAYMNCSLVPHPLASDVHYAALSAYLNYADQKKQSASTHEQPVARRIAKKLAEQSAKLGKQNNNTNRGDTDLNSQPTFVVDSPPVLPVIPVEEDMGTNPHDLTVAELAPDVPTAQPKQLVIQPQHLADPPSVLASLAPAQLVQELLGRVLSEGIGRVYLEPVGDRGRILISQDGVVQADLGNLPLATVNGAIQELKQLMHLPPTPTQKPKQVEIDRIYQGERLLLRLRLMPGKQGGEKANLHVLRGAALSFYQQQQLVLLGQEAIGIAQQLQQKMSEVYTYSRAHMVSMPSHLSILPELDRALKRVMYQLNELQNASYQDLDE